MKKNKSPRKKQRNYKRYALTITKHHWNKLKERQMPAHGKIACAHGFKNWLLLKCQHYHKQTTGAKKWFS